MCTYSSNFKLLHYAKRLVTSFKWIKEDIRWSLPNYLLLPIKHTHRPPPYFFFTSSHKTYKQTFLIPHLKVFPIIHHTRASETRLVESQLSFFFSGLPSLEWRQRHGVHFSQSSYRPHAKGARCQSEAPALRHHHCLLIWQGPISKWSVYLSSHVYLISSTEWSDRCGPKQLLGAVFHDQPFR